MIIFNIGKFGCVFVFLENVDEVDEVDVKLFGFGGGSVSIKFLLSILDKEIIYKMDRLIRGIVVIINNKNFFRFLGMDRYLRNGIDVDRDCLVKFFKMLKFDVKIYNDRIRVEIRIIIKEMVILNYFNYDVFIFFILIYGEEGVIYGIDGIILIRDFIVEFKYFIFLVGKLKLFFF